MPHWCAVRSLRHIVSAIRNCAYYMPCFALAPQRRGDAGPYTWIVGQQCIGISFWDIPMRWLGSPKPPGLAAPASSRNAFGVAFVAPAGRSFLHIRAGSIRRVPHLSGVRRGRRRFFIRDQPGDGVDYDNLPAQPPGVIYRSRRSAPLASVIDRQKERGMGN